MSNPEQKLDPVNSDDDIVENEDDLEEEEDDDENYEDDDEGDLDRASPATRDGPEVAKARMESLFRRMQSGKVTLRVHDVIVKGNTKTKDYLIEAELEAIRNATSMREIIQAASIANYRLRELDCFDSVNITLDAGPPELPGTTNVIVEVEEIKSPVSGQIGTFTKGEAKSSTVEGSIKYKNIFGYGDIWDGSVAYGFDRATEVSAGVYIPRFKGLTTPVTARVSVLSQDWLKFSSYKERSLGLSLGLYSSKHHDLAYNIAWRTLTDPSQMSSMSVKRQLGHNLLSSLKYTLTYDKRNSALRPTRGYAFVSTTHLSGLFPDNRSLRFLRQEFDLRFAVPFGFYNTALNFGISSGVLVPLAQGFLNNSSSLPDRFFLGGNLSPVCTLGGPLALWGFKPRGLGPVESRRQMRANTNDDDDANATGVDFLGGDLAVSTFADLSFDFPMKWFREKGIHGHIFVCAGNVAKLADNEYRNLSLPKFLESIRSSVGAGIVLPTSLFRLEVNYLHIVKKFDHDNAKCGFQISISAP